MQLRLLRILQEGEFSPVGSEKTNIVDVRIITATNKNLEDAIRRKEFREDLFYRLNVFPIFLPSLHQRREDIIPLAEYFLKKYANLNQKPISGFSKNAIRFLSVADFPGNVRQLENEIQHHQL